MQRQGESGSMALAALLVVAAIAFAGLAVFYVAAETNLLAQSTAHHYKHAAVAAILAVLCLVGANLARNRV